MATRPGCDVRYLAEACGVDVAAAQAALARCGGDADAASEVLLAAAAVDSQRGGQALATLVNMGYSWVVAERALSQAGSRGLEGAVAVLLDGDLSTGPSQRSATGAASASAPRPPPPPHGTAAAPGTAAASSASAAPRGEDVDDCAICMEQLRPSDAAMRCTGTGGNHHYCHAACLAGWAQQCRDRGKTPECPTCRGPLQTNRRRLRDFLDQPQTRSKVTAQESQVLRDILNQGGSDEDEWSNISWRDLAGFAILVGAALATAVLAKAAIDHFLGSERGDRRRRG